MLVYVRGAGDIATGVAARLVRAGVSVVLAARFIFISFAVCDWMLNLWDLSYIKAEEIPG